MQIGKKRQESNTVPDIKVHQERSFFESNNTPVSITRISTAVLNTIFRLLGAAVE